MIDLGDILLVEDSPEDVEMTLRALRHARLANPVEVVEDGSQAVDYLFATGAYAGRDPGRPPRVVLLDLKLPKLSGLEVLRRLRADPRTREIPVVVLTSSREDSDIAEAYRLGVNSYVVKPVEFEAFAHAVGQVGLYWDCSIRDLVSPAHGPCSTASRCMIGARWSGPDPDDGQCSDR